MKPGGLRAGSPLLPPLPTTPLPVQEAEQFPESAREWALPIRPGCPARWHCGWLTFQSSPWARRSAPPSQGQWGAQALLCGSGLGVHVPPKVEECFPPLLQSVCLSVSALKVQAWDGQRAQDARAGCLSPPLHPESLPPSVEWSLLRPRAPAGRMPGGGPPRSAGLRPGGACAPHPGAVSRVWVCRPCVP